MQKSVNPWLAAGIILFFSSLLVLYIWASNQWMKLPRLGLAKQGPTGELVFHYGDSLVFVNDQGQLLQRISAAEFGEQTFIGDFGFLSSGELLLALGHTPRRLTEKLRIFARAEKVEATPASASAAGLYACQLQPIKCRRFSQDLPPLTNSFRLWITGENQVYLANTTGHQIFWLDSEGHLLGKAVGFRYPNQLLQYKHDLVVADTNHHSLKRLSLSADTFGQVQQEIPVQLAGASGYNWPVNLLEAAGMFWVLVGDNNLSDARLARYSTSGKFIDELSLPPGTDAISLVKYNNQLLVMDAAQPEIHQFDLKGKAKGDWEIPALAQEWQRVSAAAASSLRLQRNCKWVFAITLIIGFGFAIAQARRDRKLQEEHWQSLRNTAQQSPAEIWLQPDGPVAKSLRQMPWGIAITGLALTAVQSYLAYTSAGNVKLSLVAALLMLTLLVALVLVAWLFQKRILGQSLGILGDRLVLQLADKTRVEEKYKNIFWSDGGLMIKHKRLAINFNQSRSLYKLDALQMHLLPRLLAEKKISSAHLFWLQLKQDRYALISFMAMLIAVLVSLSIKWIIH